MVSDNSKRIIKYLILSAILIMVGIIIPLTLGLGTQSIYDEGVGDTLTFYQKFFWGLLVVGAIKLVFILSPKNNKYGDGVGFSGTGEKPALSFFKNFSTLQLFLLSLIIFGSIFFVANIINVGSLTGFKVLPTVAQQFTKGQSLLFSSFVIPVSENLLLAGVIALALLGLSFLAIRLKLSEKEYKQYAYLSIPLLGGALGWIWHSTVYAGSDVSLGIVFAFWTLGTLLTLLTGSFIPFWVIHILNNFFIDFSRLYSSDTLSISIMGALLGIIILYITLYGFKITGKNKKETFT